MSNTGTFGITGIPIPDDVIVHTDIANNIPYVTGMPLRYEITKFYNTVICETNDEKRKQWTLFIFALERFKALHVDDKLSYFQVAGIHGFPSQSWDGADGGAYCHHNTVAFPTWHRPYMLLFEQCLWMNMNEVINAWVKTGVITDGDAEAWRSAAKRWRLFYWDWAVKQQYPGDEPFDNFGIPYLFTVPNVRVFTPRCPQGTDEPNPLWGFANPESDQATDKPLAFGNMPDHMKQWNIPDDENLPWSQCTATSRYGILLVDPKTKTYSGLDGINDWEKCNATLSTAGSRFYLPTKTKKSPKIKLTASGGEITLPSGENPAKEPDEMTPAEWDKMRPNNLADAVNRMFSEYYNDKWTTFASTKWYKDGHANTQTGFLSLEYIHNNIHNITGGSSLGPDGSDQGPDPIYGLGHLSDPKVAAFDPIFWMHHANIDRYTAMWQCLNWNKWFEQEPSNGSKQEKDVKPYDPLQPFHRTDGGKPDDELNQWTSDLARDWTKLGYQYDDLMPLTGGAIGTDGKLLAPVYQTDLLQHINKLYPGTARLAYDIRAFDGISNPEFFGPQTSHDEAFPDYIINVLYDRYALAGGRSYSIEFSLAGQYVGHVYSLGGFPPDRCANCASQRAAGVLSKAQVPISLALMRRAADPEVDALHHVTEEVVEKYLEENLGVAYVDVGGRVLDARDFPDTRILVLAGKATWRTTEGGDGEKKWLTPWYAGHGYKVLEGVTERLEGGVGREEGERWKGYGETRRVDDFKIEPAPAI